MAHLIYLSISSLDGYIEDRDGNLACCPRLSSRVD